MQKIVLSKDGGSLRLTRRAVERMAAKGNQRARAVVARDRVSAWHGYGHVEGFPDDGWERDSPELLSVVIEFGQKAGLECVPVILEIPNGVKWEIHDDCGDEYISENHRTWYPSENHRTWHS